MACAAGAFTKNATHMTAMHFVSGIDELCLPEPVVL